MAVQHKDLGLNELHSTLAFNGLEIITVSTEDGSKNYAITFGGSTNKKVVYNTTSNYFEFYVNSSTPSLKIYRDRIVLPNTSTIPSSPSSGTIYFNNTLASGMIYDGIGWMSLAVA